jgi:hypothetical protein
MDDRAPDAITNGRGAAAVLAAAIGALALGLAALAGDASPHVAAVLNIWKPTGPLSGVTDAAILVWLAAWFALSRRWARRAVNMVPVNLTALAMFVAALLLTFPPFMDLLQGK